MVHELALAPADKHPNDNKELPSFESAAYRAIAPDLAFCSDVFDGLKCCVANRKIVGRDKLQQYFPKEKHEPNSAYDARMIRAAFNNKYQPTIKGFAGILPIDSLSDDVHPSIVENESNVDLRGNNLDAFWSAADELALRDGAVAILVEYPRQPRNEKGEKLIRNAADEKRFKLRPYLCLIERKDILSWRVSYQDGRMLINQIIFRECRTEPDGLYGEKQEIYYRVLRPGSFEVWKLVKRDTKDWEAELVESGTTTLDTVPLVAYSATDVCAFDAEPPFKALAEMNVSYHDLYLGYRELIHKLHLPVPVRKGLVQPGLTDFSNLPPLIIGSNTCIDITSDGDFFFAEPSGASLAGSRTELDKLQNEMSAFTLGFLSSESGEAKTATEVQLAAGSTQANLAGMALKKESAIEEVFKLWAAYYQSDIGGSASVNKDILQVRLDPQIVSAYSAMAAQNQISLLTFLKMLKEGKVLPRDVEPDAEIEQVTQQIQERQEQAIATMEAQAKVASQDEEKSQSENREVK